MKLFRFIPVTFLIIFLLPFCGKDIEKYDSDYTGFWYSDTVVLLNTGDTVSDYLEIKNPNSSFGFACQTEHVPSVCQYLFTGKAKIDHKRRRIIIGGQMANQLKINEEPNQDASGTWTMVLGDKRYHKRN